ncbi:MAG: histidinol-phosphate transaminase [Gammaproteobacteria bacterium]|nr:histidinol-phosphate transaminase [Gammaproteobacteria bacterium]NND40371.1 histidinol-phosphate transaminase [Pseudomonadales bacterium]MBT8152161.1 histidinol-phosphate transaminase [Gammaproteobacteria bacterium]NNL10415.1 histidinol-phosphate transaminase [Pseudomonadales bacterium]NNM12566.1 histidinol-phosphate transaminase [Pseudomonadales bacterium]
MSQLWSQFVRELKPYVPGAQGGGEQVVKLNTNENPYPPSPRVTEVLRDFNAGDLRLYPQPESDDLVKTIARYHGLNTDQVFVGNGSDEILAHAFNALFRRNSPLLFPDLTYSFYPVYCKLFDIAYKKVALDASFQINVADYAGATGGIVFANPNAPTSLLLAQHALRDLLASAPDSAVLVDEAYIDFSSAPESRASAIALLNECSNLLVTRTLSKSRSLAGLRVGYALGSPELIEALRRVKNSFNSYPVDALASALAIASFEDEEYFQAMRQRVLAERARLVDALRARGFEALDSAANFLMVRHSSKKARGIYQGLHAKDVWVRYFDLPRIENYLRISVGSAEQNDALLDALDTL